MGHECGQTLTFRDSRLTEVMEQNREMPPFGGDYSRSIKATAAAGPRTLAPANM